MLENNNIAWELEYQKPTFLTLGTEPLSDVKEFMRWIKKEVRKNPADFSAPITEWSVLDLGCGNGKNLQYIVENYAQKGIGYDISSTALHHAQTRKGLLPIEYKACSISDPFTLDEKSIDLVLDVTTSNSLSETVRAKFLKEISRVLKPKSYCFTRALCKDGDTNAKNLIKNFPGPEKDTYVLTQTGITERVFSREDFINLYTDYFEIVLLQKTTGYQRWGNQSYKRNYWIAYLKKR